MTDTRTIIEHVKMGEETVEVRFDYDFGTSMGQVRILPETAAPVNVKFIVADESQVERLGRVLIMLAQMMQMDSDTVADAMEHEA